MIIEYFGPSGSGKTFESNNFYKFNKHFNNHFLLIAKMNKFLRVFYKLSFFIFAKPRDVYNIYLLHKSFIFYSKIIQFQNFFAFMYLCCFLRYQIFFRKRNILLDQGFFQLLLSCYIYSKSLKSNNIVIKNFKLILKDFIVQNYRIIKTSQNLFLSKEKLLKRESAKYVSDYYNSMDKIKISLDSVNEIIDVILR